MCICVFNLNTKQPITTFELFTSRENNASLAGLYSSNIVTSNASSEAPNCNKIKTGSLCASVTDHETDEGRFQKCVAKAKYIILFEVFFGEDARKRKMNTGDSNIHGIKKVKKKKASRKCSCFLNKNNWPFRKRCYSNCFCGNIPRSCLGKWVHS